MTQSDRTARSPSRAAGASPSSHQVLDPCTLGRPIHLLHSFAARLREDLSELFRTRLNRRYRADFQVEAISIDAAGKAAPPASWLGYAAADGRIGCALDRSLVLSALAYRYGLRGDEAPASGAAESFPETATEERLAAMLGLHLVDTLAGRIESGLDAGAGDAPERPEFAPLGPIPPLRSACLIRATIRESTHAVRGDLYLALDDAWMARLLGKLGPMRRKRNAGAANTAPLAGRLRFKLTARLLEKDLTLGELLAIRPGDVIPISLRAADVLIGESRLFGATVAEHKGKLCLTSFEDVK